MISKVEKDYISKGIAAGIRNDGRGPNESRQLELETGIINQASGSCRVSVRGGTEVLVGIKVSVGDIQELDTRDEEEEAMKNRADVGRIVCSVECSPSAKIVLDKRQIEEMCILYTQILNRTLNGPQGGLDLYKLCIIPGSVCWILNIDVLILNYGGSVFDAIFMAVRGAIHNTRLAKVKVESTDGAFDFEVEDDETEVLEGRENVPVAVTAFQIDKNHVIDAMPLEEQCSDSSVSVMVNKHGKLCGVQKGLKGSLETSLLINMIQHCQNKGQEVISAMDSFLAQEERRIIDLVEPVGFR
ncbi:Exosome complex component RRP42 [Boothiomyces macroporosus]|uniref:Ribosomal RNA-processing protein 42 n=1 Tax=Boothiomyces macroporosus TaxID=261099 RepID=A0AAD5UEB5_9FUNG|nr:Exosome complex component RRP42 [Boothiomyces macroporosus]